ncbi:SusF/SusE family outer membrane protein [uncultured Bacteroides sp.]|uniref:SusF/SusE family outer membrane protein n=1 Tax=uncultured Bacteroides sp. TaxID=162156 RepID=UPI0023D62D44|nr:SusF/SusE family outer membrane protein [uncultured Bacteroides sp.]MDE5759915.1 SusF/SusE family outer membrane protein [Bacteroides sp.]MDE6347543.1 SusF/SusE family outer membrane protein [Bacteroides sp.]
MKAIHILTSLIILSLAFALAACEGEKDLIVIEGNLPIKTSTFYMVGDATPAGWDIGNPTALTPTEEDPLVFVYEGHLNSGEMKCCLKTGDWGAPFVRPVTNGCEISGSGVQETTFIMYAGDPDNKWRVTEAGNYRLTFDLRNWTIAAQLLGK